MSLGNSSVRVTVFLLRGYQRLSLSHFPSCLAGVLEKKRGCRILSTGPGFKEPEQPLTGRPLIFFWSYLVVFTYVRRTFPLILFTGAYHKGDTSTLAAEKQGSRGEVFFSPFSYHIPTSFLSLRMERVY